MPTIRNSFVAGFDIDDTLIMWDFDPNKKKIYLERNGGLFEVNPHMTHIKQLKRHLYRGHHVIVWSKGNYQWAEEAIQALVRAGLLTKKEQDVIETMCKPHVVYDDLPAEGILPSVAYLKDVE